ncbi:MAG: NADP-dependent phosphogluconate dehydrogenase [Firmicutes bacterium]|nr:NADP-dependent phosphogluconate dehydrogenase [Bacillota bacterium]
MHKKNDIGLIGLAVMGQNLALNIASKGYSVSVYNRPADRPDDFIAEKTNDNLKASYTLTELVNSLKKPRKIILMIRAGKPVDMVLDNLLPLLEKGDIIIDGGNSYFKDTNRRYEKLLGRGIQYLGVGISGGEYGALHGPSIMPGGSEKAYEKVAGILTDIAAQGEHGPCVSYLGPDSSGHYVKMVHNGIEYAVMQVISEAYDLMTKLIKMSPEEISRVFEEWNKRHRSYLLEITYIILEKKDSETGQTLINTISDQAEQKGTGKWSVQDALELGVPIPIIGAAVNARFISSLIGERKEFNRLFNIKDNTEVDRGNLLQDLEGAFYLVVIMSYAEGMKLLQTASENYDYNLQLDVVARIWENGCIIRSALLLYIQEVYRKNPALSNLILSDEFILEFRKNIDSLRRIVTESKQYKMPLPAMEAALDYFDSICAADLPANLIQAQRDYFGAHGYRHRDKEGFFHTEW